jgi:hypothetical protein
VAAATTKGVLDRRTARSRQGFDVRAGTDILELLNAFVLSEPGPPGFSGKLAFGVRSAAGGDTWWAARVGATVETSFEHERPSDADALLFLGDEEANAILGEGRVPPSPRLLELAGDSELIQRFLRLERYVVATLMFAID